MPRSGKSVLGDGHAQGLHTFRIFKDPATASTATRKRSKFDSNRRKEVGAVRNKRSCLRCALLKIRCSEDDCCITCEQLVFATHNHEKKTLSFSGCIRTRLREVSVFESYIATPAKEDTFRAELLDSTVANISLECASEVAWDLEALVGDVVKWLTDPSSSNTSKVGILASPQFLDLVQGSALVKDQDDAGTKFRVMLYTMSRCYTKCNGPVLTVDDYARFGSKAGHAFLELLDRILKPDCLKTCSEDDLRTAFLWVFGTTLAVGYAGYPTPAPHLGSFEAMQSHLCQILAHYLLYLGSRINLPLPAGVDHFILKGAMARWNKEGRYDWTRPRTGDLPITFEEVIPHDTSNSSSFSAWSSLDPSSSIYVDFPMSVEEDLSSWQSTLLGLRPPIDFDIGCSISDRCATEFRECATVIRPYSSEYSDEYSSQTSLTHSITEKVRDDPAARLRTDNDKSNTCQDCHVPADYGWCLQCLQSRELATDVPMCYDSTLSSVLQEYRPPLSSPIKLLIV